MKKIGWLLTLLFIVNGYSSDNVKNYCFDMGAADSPAESGFILIAQNTKYDETRGFGWIIKPGQTFDDPDSEAITKLSRDGVASSKNMVFRIDAVPGQYFMSVTVNNGLSDEDTQISILVNDTVFEDSVTIPWYRMPFRTICSAINITDPTVDVTVVADHGIAGICAIELRAATPNDQISFDTPLEEDTAAVAEKARELKRFLDKNPNNIAAENQINLLEKYLLACYYYDIGWWSWAVKQTGMSIFNRFWYASDLLRQIVADPDDPLFYRTAFLLGKIHYWLFQEQGLLWNDAEAKKYFRIVHRKYPDHKLVRMYLGDKIPHYFEHIHKSHSDAPHWAVTQREAMARILEIIHWWVDNRQVENGELGGKYGDDVEMLRWWLPAILGADDPKARLGFMRLVEGVWNSGKLENGFAKKIDDVEHSAEFITDTHPVMLMLDYGNPVYIERCMLSMQNFRDTWTAINSKGHRHFKSCYISATDIIDEPPYAVDVAMNARATVAGLWTAWYNQNPTIVRMFSEWGQAWIDDALRTDKGKPAGILPAAVRFDNDEIGGYSDNWYHPNLGWDYYNWELVGSISEMYNQLTGMYSITSDTTFLKPLNQTIRFIETPNDPQTVISEGSAEWAKKVLTGEIVERRANPEKFWLVVGRTKILTQSDYYDDFLKNHGSHYLNYLFSDDPDHLVQGCEEIIQQLNYNFELRTSEVKFTDRVYVPNADHLFGMYTGGIGKGREFPVAAVTWENTGTDIAIIVTEAKTDYLDILLYNFGEPKEISMNVWRLAPGEYVIRTGTRQNGSFESSREKHKLTERGEKLKIAVPARQVFRIECEQQKQYPFDLTSMPDVGLSENDITLSNQNPVVGENIQISAKIHNIGNAAAHDFFVNFYIDDNKIAVHKIKSIEPPNDLASRTRTVTARWIAEKGEHKLKISASISGQEITRRNNEQVVTVNVR